MGLGRGARKRARGGVEPSGWWFILGLAALGAGGYFGYTRLIAGAKKATFSSRLNDTNIVYNLRFGSEAPPNPRDVELVISSDQMVEGKVTYDWAYIAEHDVDPKTTPDQDPPPEIRFVVELAPPAGIMKARAEVTGYPVLVTKLYWGGRLQDRDSSNLSAHYTSQR